MRQIGFKNFRKFADFPLMDLAPITILVGENNAGKSTVVKGNRKDEEGVSGTVSKILLQYPVYRIFVEFDLQNDRAEITFYPNANIDKNQSMPQSYFTYFESFDRECSIKNIPISENLNYYDGEIINSLIKSLERGIDATIYPISEEEKNQDRSFFGGSDKPIEGLDSEQMNFLKKYTSLFGRLAGRSNRAAPYFFRLPIGYRFVSRALNIEYLYAHAVTQTVIYSAKDTNDYLSRTIHEFASVKEKKHHKEFITEWMKKFGIGSDYEIKSVGGEAHIVYIVNNDGEKVNLADKGMGSIQLMVLLFRLAITLPSHTIQRAAQEYRSYRASSIVIIEEPEQNLHPMLQSKLADLLFQLNQNYGYRFIIETHSEYLVRRSQVLVGDNFDTEQKLKKNPFKVYYFPSEGEPYDMVYTTSGLFEKKFGDGFINEAGKLHMAILKNAKNNK